MAGDAAYCRDWLLGDPAAQRPELGAPLHLEGGGPGQPRRAQLGAQAGRGLPGQLRVAGRAPGEFGGPLLDLLRRQGLPGQAELRGSQAGDLLAEDPGRVIRSHSGKPRATDGPYSETKEVLGGFYTIEAASYDEAVKLALEHPHLEYGGTIEVRQLFGQ